MIASPMEIESPQPTSGVTSGKRSLLTAAGAVGAILTSACCVGPLVLLALGISGAWIGSLAALDTYKPVFAAIAVIFIGLGFRQVYFPAKPACSERAFCKRPASALITKSVLWVAAVLVAVAITIDWWAPIFY
ncbi:MAG: mercuric transporter MerT family protein [Dongiaceae bacterium]